MSTLGKEARVLCGKSTRTWRENGVGVEDDQEKAVLITWGSEQILELREERTRPNIHAHFPATIIACQSL